MLLLFFFFLSHRASLSHSLSSHLKLISIKLTLSTLVSLKLDITDPPAILSRRLASNSSRHPSQTYATNPSHPYLVVVVVFLFLFFIFPAMSCGVVVVVIVWVDWCQWVAGFVNISGWLGWVSWWWVWVLLGGSGLG